MVKKVSHVAIAVPDIEQAAKFYTEKLGLSVSGREVVAGSKVRVGFIPVGRLASNSCSRIRRTRPSPSFLRRGGLACNTFASRWTTWRPS